MSINCWVLRVVTVMIFGALFIFESSVYADTIYLNDGTMIKGAIKSEDEKTILIETGNIWKRVNKSDIESINKDIVPEEKQTETNVQAQQPSEATPQSVTDMRIKFGTAAQIDKLTENGISSDINGEASSNIQMEVNAIMYGQSNVGLLLSAGFFARDHAGSDKVISQNKIDYDAVGFSLGIGMGIKANDHLHFEGKAELGLGEGNAKITAPGQFVGSTTSGGYASLSLIAGAYYTFSKPGFQIGLELGAQTFNGKFTYNSLYDETVEGSNGTANLVVGYRF